MAQKVDEFPFLVRGGKYNWDELLDGNAWRLTQGEDFSCKPQSLQAIARVAAKSRGSKLRTAVGDGWIVIQAVREKSPALVDLAKPRRATKG